MNPALRFALVCVVAWVVLVLLMQRRMIYPAPPAPSDFPFADGLEVWKLGDDRVEALFLPAHSSNGPSPALIFAHGNAELVDYNVHEFEPARAQGMAVLLVEFPGYGRSGGSPSEPNIARVFEAAYDRLAAHASVLPDRIVGWGRSLGGGAIGNLSRSRKLAALVFESTFTSTRPLAASMFVPPFLVLDRYDNARAVREFDGPVLIVHGERDTLIPPDHARQLDAHAKRSELHLLPCGHNDCPRPWDAIGPFLRRATDPMGSSQ